MTSSKPNGLANVVTAKTSARAKAGPTRSGRRARADEEGSTISTAAITIRGGQEEGHCGRADVQSSTSHHDREASKTSRVRGVREDRIDLGPSPDLPGVRCHALLRQFAPAPCHCPRATDDASSDRLSGAGRAMVVLLPRRRLYRVLNDAHARCLACASPVGVGRHVRHASHVDADRGQDSSRARATRESLVACSPLRVCAWIDLVRDPVRLPHVRDDV